MSILGTMIRSTQPLEITRDAGDQRMLVRWADGHVSHYPWRDLRFVCPCAFCGGEWGQPGALTNATLAYATKLADKGWRPAMAADPALALGLNTHGGHVTYAAVAEAFGMDSIDVAEVLS